MILPLGASGLSPWYLLAAAGLALAVAVAQLQRGASRSIIVRTAERAREEASGRLAESQAMLRSIVTNNMAAIAVVTLDGSEVLVNDAYRRLVAPLMNDDRARAWRAAAVHATDAPVRDEVVFAGAGREDERVLDAIRFPLHDRTGAVYAVCTVALDVTDRRRMTEELRRSNTELERFATAASHDLREPLRTIHGFAELVAERYGHALDENGHRFVDAITEGAERGIRLVDDLLRLSRAGSGELSRRDVALDAVFHEALANLETLRTEREGSVDIGPLPPAHADPARIAQVAQNLLANALKHVPADRRPEVTVRGTRRGDDVEITVADNGEGVPAESRERIFEVFVRLGPVDGRSGSGLGLALSRRIVERHGGRLWVDEHPGGGSAFRFTLPASRAVPFDPR